MRTSGHKVLVTGGTRGIGLAIAERFASAGNRIVVVGSSERSIEPIAAAHPDWVVYVCDLSVADERQALLSWLAREHGDLSVLINNAGIQEDAAITSGDVSVLRREIGINVEAVVHLCEHVAEILQAQGEAAIVNISSGLAIAPKASAPVYCASKAFVRSYSIALRYQLEAQGIRVFDLAPPLVKTDMTAGRNDNGMSAQALADELWDAWEADRFYIAAGKTRLLEWIHRLSPSLARRVTRDM